MSYPQYGVLLVNLGTPEAPTPSAIKRYLSQFLQDHRVVDMPRILWYPILKGIILPRRSPKVAKLYQAIWMEGGSPLLVYSRQQQQALSERLPDMPVELAMTYGTPSMSDAVARLMDRGVTEICVLPLFPQYSCSTTAAVWDAFSRVLQQRRDIPGVRFIRDYAEHPDYITALAETIQNSFKQHGQPDLLLFSYHGIPLRYTEEGDDYAQRCEATTKAVAARLGLQPNQYKMAYQSRFGREEWLQPYTDTSLEQFPNQGIKHIQVLCPGFAADCLETLEEIEVQNKALFLQAGGEMYYYIPALNANKAHIDLFVKLVVAEKA